MHRQHYVYILASKSRCFYVGVTNDLRRRWTEHVSGIGSKHCARYHIRHLVYYEIFNRPMDAIRREKVLKRRRRAEKIALITAMNPGWRDFAVEWGWHRSRPGTSAARDGISGVGECD